MPIVLHANFPHASCPHANSPNANCPSTEMLRPFYRKKCYGHITVKNVKAILP